MLPTLHDSALISLTTLLKYSKFHSIFSSSTDYYRAASIFSYNFYYYKLVFVALELGRGVIAGLTPIFLPF